ncbi:lipoate--protein ligase family protein [Halomicrobium salinisoli]|uniref:lipoate--protein ligase family protein n=1 Tax=Halomicrobium salinisoli TaxID=2878391 RepID=UPI001CF0876C|nr:biotin/lipoate A/B protein ligase family protein [Halomicrobium salinisoli]
MTDLAGLDWRVIGEEARPGAETMALDEVAAATAGEGGPATVRVYQWSPSTLSLGYSQDPETVDWDYCEREGIDVVRRPTGGGAIYHDEFGDVSYSIVVPADAVPGDLMDSYELLCQPVLEAFAAMGVDADFASEERPAVYEPACYLRPLHPAHDVVGPDGRKISGNAQYRQRDAVVQHGSLTVRRNADRHTAVFDADLDPDAFRDRVTSIEAHADGSREAVVETLTDTLADWAGVQPNCVRLASVDDQRESTGVQPNCVRLGSADERSESAGADPGSWTDDELDRAADLVDAKYGTDAWTREGEDPT